MALSAPQIVDILKKHRILPPEWEKETEQLAANWSGAGQFLEELQRRGWLTAHQREMLGKNRLADLVLGPYVVLEPLGAGGMGQVFRARHTLLNRVAAVKVLRPDRIGPADLERFQREMQAAAKLSHPNVVLAYDAVQAGERLVYAMELVRGNDLQEVIRRRGPVPIDQACAWVRQAALGLQHIHEHGLVHRDIKPANLLLAEQPNGPPVVKVSDLGLARLGTGPGTEGAGLTSTGMVMGTPDYLPPEQAGDARNADIRADIYSLGCTLYHLLTGQVPFPGGSVAQKITWHHQSEPAAVEQIRKDVPAELAQVVRRMMAKKPADRFRTPAEVAAALTPFLQEDSTGTTHTYVEGGTGKTPVPGPAPETQVAAAGSRRLLLILGAGGGLALVALLLFLLFGRGPTGGPTGPAAVVEVRLVGWMRPADPMGATVKVDGKAVPLEDLDRGLALAPGPHVLVVEEGGKETDRREFVVLPEMKGGKLVLPETEAPVGALHLLNAHDEVTGIGYSGDGLRLMSVGPGATAGVHIWETSSARLLYHLARGGPKAGKKLMKGVPNCGALSPEGNTVLLGHLGAFRGMRTTPFFRVLGLDSQTVQFNFGDHGKTVGCVAYSPDGKLALSACAAGETRIWDAVKWVQLHQQVGNVACFTADGSHVVAARGRTARLFPLSEPRELAVFEGHENDIRSMVCSPDGRHLLTGGDTTARLWDLATAKEVRRFKGHEKEVTSVALSPDGRRVLTGSRDGTVRLWDAAEGKEIQRFVDHTKDVTGVAYSPGGRRAASGSLDGTVRVWSLPR